MQFLAGSLQFAFPIIRLSVLNSAEIGLVTLALLFVVMALACWLMALVLAATGERHASSPLCAVITGSGAVMLLLGAILALNGAACTWVLPPPIGLAIAAVALRLDPLAAFFLLVTAAVSIPVVLYTPAYMEHLRRHVDMRMFWACMPLLMLSMSLVILAANVLTFLVAWELMSLSSFALVATDSRPRATRRAALIYLSATRLGTGLLAGGFLWEHALTHTWAFDGWRLSGSSALGPALLVAIGLGVKGGMWPFHLWLPVAHPAAPSPVSALMSGVMVKVAIYMMVRLFVLSPTLAHPAIGYLLLVIGAISAFWGVLFALLQHDLKRLLAYHTVENVGLILIGVGGAIVAADLGLSTVAVIAAGAALFHVLNHALFKSLLFLGAGSVQHSTHTLDLERLGGLGRRMRWTFGCFALGAAAICALPPLNGFASEWLLYQSALGLASSPVSPILRFSALMMIGWIALIGALALACFMKAVGVVFEGRPRSQAAAQAVEAPASMVAAQIILAAACVLLGLSAPIVLRALQPLTAALSVGARPLSSAWTIPTGSLALVLMLTVGVGGLWLSSLARHGRVRPYITWECGFGDLTPRMQMAAISFAQPIARMFGVVFQYAVDLHIEGTSRRLFPDEISVEPRTEALLETRVYSPAVRGVYGLGGWVARMQAGSIHLYLLTMFITLVVLLAIGGAQR